MLTSIKLEIYVINILSLFLLVNVSPVNNAYICTKKFSFFVMIFPVSEGAHYMI